MKRTMLVAVLGLALSGALNYGRPAARGAQGAPGAAPGCRRAAARTAWWRTARGGPGGGRGPKSA